METVPTSWDREVDGIDMWRFHQKRKRLANTLIAWSRKKFVNIILNVRMYEEHVHKAEEDYTLYKSDANRKDLHDVNAKYITFFNRKDTTLKQKLNNMGSKMVTEILNISIPLERRRKSFVHKIICEDGEQIQDEDDIDHTTCAHIEEIFIVEEKLIKENTLDCIPMMVSQEQNSHLTSLPNTEELKRVIFFMIPNFAADPEGING